MKKYFAILSVACKSSLTAWGNTGSSSSSQGEGKGKTENKDIVLNIPYPANL